MAADADDAQVRSFRLDWITAPTLRQGTFDVAAGFDAGSHVVDKLAVAPRRHIVSVRVRASVEQVRARIPAGLALAEQANQPGWVRMRLNAEGLDWLPALLAGLDHPFIVEEPAVLHDRVRALARQREQYAGQTASSTRVTHHELRAHTDRR